MSFENSELDIARSQELLFGTDVRTGMMVGVNQLADAVKTTLGPRGRNAIIYRGNSAPIITKDGVTVAKSIRPNNPVARMGVDLVYQVSKQACNEAGDGTTTATVLAQAIATLAIADVDNYSNPVIMYRGIMAASEALQEQLKKNAVECTTKEQMINIATISANGDAAIGDIVGNAVFAAGQYGHVIVEPSRAGSDNVINTKGIRTEHGYLNPGFINDLEKQTMHLRDVRLVLVDGDLTELAPYRAILETAALGKVPLVFIAQTFSDTVTASITQLNTKARFKLVGLLQSSGYSLRRKEMLRDLAAYTNATVTGDEGDVPVEDFEFDMCGSAEEIILERKQGIIISTAGDPSHIQGRINLITKQLEDEKLSPFERTRMLERKGLLSGGISKIEVGGSTEVEMKERKDRYDDAVCAVNSACDMGVLAGGGTALIVAAMQLDDCSTEDLDFKRGWDIVMQAIETPAHAISSNAGLNGDDTLAILREQILSDVEANGMSNFGYNAATSVFGDMVDMNVLDPAKVTCSAIKYAASIAGIIVTTEVGIVG